MYNLFKNCSLRLKDISNIYFKRAIYGESSSLKVLKQDEAKQRIDINQILMRGWGSLVVLFSHWVTHRGFLTKKAAHTGEKDTQCDHFSPWMVCSALKWEDQSQASVWKINERTRCMRLICLVNSGSKEEQHALYHVGRGTRASTHSFYLLVKNKLKFKIYLIFN